MEEKVGGLVIFFFSPSYCEMPPKNKKSLQKESAKLVEDKTFGLKNKNKSKKVQQYVSQVQRQAEHKVQQSSRKAGEPSSAQPKLSKKQMLEARMAELALVYRPVKEKVKVLSPEEEEKKRLEEEAETERLRILSLPVEDQIEEERSKLTKKTPVTLDLFLKWKEEKRLLREKDAEKKKKAVIAKGQTKGELKKGGVLTGRELFEYNKDVFVDDEAADDGIYERRDAADSDEEEEESKPQYDDRDEEDAHKKESDALHGQDDSEKEAGDDTANAVGDESLFS